MILRTGRPLKLPPAMDSAGVEVLRRHLPDDRPMRLDPDLVRELLAAALAVRF